MYHHMLLYCHAVGSFHYKMERTLDVFLHFLDCDICRADLFKRDQVAGSQNVKHKIFMIYC